MNTTKTALLFFSQEEAATIEAITARLIPGTSEDPGAKEACAMVFIDRALAGYVSHLQVFYRRGLDLFDAFCIERHGQVFRKLTEAQQDDMLRAIEGSGELEQSGRLGQFFAVVYEHTLEGTFCDPVHGGNRNAAGWRMIGFPGAHWGYSKEQMQYGYPSRAIPISTLADIEALDVPSQGGH